MRGGATEGSESKRTPPSIETGDENCEFRGWAMGRDERSASIEEELEE